MRIFIFSLGEKMNLNQETPRVDKKRSGLEGGSGYIISSEQEGWAKKWFGGGEVERRYHGRRACYFTVAPASVVRSTGASGQLRSLLLETSYISVCTRGLGSQLSSSADMAASFGEQGNSSLNHLTCYTVIAVYVFLSLFMSPMVPRSWRVFFFVFLVFVFFFFSFFCIFISSICL